MTLTCGLSLGDPGWIPKMWAEIYDRAREKGKIVEAKLGPHNFEYALINPKDQYGRARKNKNGEYYRYSGKKVTFWIKDEEKQNSIGLNWVGFPFVLEKSVPRKDFLDYIGLHEWAEANFEAEGSSFPLGVYGRMIHNHGCKTELEQVLNREKEFVDSYADWVVNRLGSQGKKGYFERAIPGFLDVIKKELSPTQVLKEFKHQLDLGYHLSW